MYQQEMFSRGAFKQATFIGAGCAASVFEIPGGKVVKYARNDACRNYLEWCFAMQQAGKGMLGMPEIELITPLEDGMYMVIMKRYSVRHDEIGEAADFEPFYSTSSWDERLSSFSKVGVEASHLEELANAFEDYMRGMFFPRGFDWCDDMHSGNFAVDTHRNTAIMLDPSCDGYQSSPYQPEFTLQ